MSTERTAPPDLHRTLFADGPMLFFGGPYSNLEATLALLAEAKRRGIPPSRTVCTGDVVAYGADAAATVDLLISAGVHVVMGNCEESLALNREDCGCGFAEGTLCEALSSAWYRHADGTIGPHHRSWMAGLPRRIDIVIGGRRLAVIHGGVAQISRFLFASTPAEWKLADIASAGCDGIVGGHCGLPFTELLGRHLWHNPGVIGMPANDGTPRTWFSVLAPGADGIEIRHHPLVYDHASAADKMRAYGLPEGYAAALASGLWPSLEVLPEAERAARGQPMAPAAFVWKASTLGAIHR